MGKKKSQPSVALQRRQGNKSRKGVSFNAPNSALSSPGESRSPGNFYCSFNRNQMPPVARILLAALTPDGTDWDSFRSGPPIELSQGDMGCYRG